MHVKRSELYLAMLFVAACSMLVMACSGLGNNNDAKKLANQIRSQDVLDINQTLVQLRKAEPLPKPKDSAALRVQGAWYTADSDPNKEWYVTLISLDGTPYMHLTTRGAPQPAGDQVTNPQQQICAGGSNGDKNCDTIGLPEPNGVHQGTADQTYLAVLTTGAIARFSCGCVISDQPFSVKTPVKFSIDETAAISHTDTTKSTGAVVPGGSGQRK
jgi:hypothetical protein